MSNLPLVHRLRIRLPTLFFQNLKYADDSFPDVVLQLIYRFALGVAARQSWNLSPKAALRIFVDDNGVVLHASIFPHQASRFRSPWPI